MSGRRSPNLLDGGGRRYRQHPTTVMSVCADSRFAMPSRNRFCIVDYKNTNAGRRCMVVLRLSSLWLTRFLIFLLGSYSRMSRVLVPLKSIAGLV